MVSGVYPIVNRDSVSAEKDRMLQRTATVTVEVHRSVILFDTVI